jgi:hypothetical protein
MEIDKKEKNINTTITAPKDVIRSADNKNSTPDAKQPIQMKSNEGEQNKSGVKLTITTNTPIAATTTTTTTNVTGVHSAIENNTVPNKISHTETNPSAAVTTTPSEDATKHNRSNTPGGVLQHKPVAVAATVTTSPSIDNQSKYTGTKSQSHAYQRPFQMQCIPNAAYGQYVPFAQQNQGFNYDSSFMGYQQYGEYQQPYQDAGGSVIDDGFERYEQMGPSVVQMDEEFRNNVQQIDQMVRYDHRLQEFIMEKIIQMKGSMEKMESQLALIANAVIYNRSPNETVSFRQQKIGFQENCICRPDSSLGNSTQSEDEQSNRMNMNIEDVLRGSSDGIIVKDTIKKELLQQQLSPSSPNQSELTKKTFFQNIYDNETLKNIPGSPHRKDTIQNAKDDNHQNITPTQSLSSTSSAQQRSEKTVTKIVDNTGKQNSKISPTVSDDGTKKSTVCTQNAIEKSDSITELQKKESKEQQIEPKSKIVMDDIFMDDPFETDGNISWGDEASLSEQKPESSAKVILIDTYKSSKTTTDSDKVIVAVERKEEGEENEKEYEEYIRTERRESSPSNGILQRPKISGERWVGSSHSYYKGNVHRQYEKDHNPTRNDGINRRNFVEQHQPAFDRSTLLKKCGHEVYMECRCNDTVNRNTTRIVRTDHSNMVSFQPQTSTTMTTENANQNIFYEPPKLPWITAPFFDPSRNDNDESLVKTILDIIIGNGCDNKNEITTTNIVTKLMKMAGMTTATKTHVENVTTTETQISSSTPQKKHRKTPNTEIEEITTGVNAALAWLLSICAIEYDLQNHTWFSRISDTEQMYKLFVKINKT